MPQPPRVVIDETSIDFTGRALPTVERWLDDCCELLETLFTKHVTVALHPCIYEQPCAGGTYFGLLLSGSPVPLTGGSQPVDRDIRVRCLRLLDRCVVWDEEQISSYDAIIQNGTPSFAPSVVYAHAVACRGRRVACLVIGDVRPAGELMVVVDGQSAHVAFVRQPEHVALFFRTIFAGEDVSESEFFSLATMAFPALRFEPSLSFARFDGHYRQVRDRAVQILAVINDRFLATRQAHKGDTQRVIAELRPHGLDVSMESPGTRASERLMRARDVRYEGRVYRCEWHAKLEPHRNRIHFSPLGDSTVLIGIFVSHLAT